MQKLPFTLKGEIKEWNLLRVRVLGKGSFGLATLVQDQDDNKFYVAKEVNLQCIKKASELEGLHKEISILKSVQHPNVVRYVDSSSDDAQFVLTILMEYCDGGDLHERIKACGDRGMAESEVASMLIQILVALRHLHMDHRILHRDLKPQNIFLTKDGIVKLGDFGVSTVLTGSIDFAKTFCGSPYYLAPELCEEKPYNGKADMWSVGVILYECMSKGTRPFPAKNLVALVMQITKAQYDPAPLKTYSTELADIVGLLLQRLPVNRPTFARLMRMPYVREHLSVLPRSLIDSPAYGSALGSKYIQHAQQRKNNASSGELSSELQAWALRDREQLAKQEAKIGLKGKAFEEELSERQKREMLALSGGTTSSRSRTGTSTSPSAESAPPVTSYSTAPVSVEQHAGTATIPASGRRATLGNRQVSANPTGEEDDDVWNSRYDDDFEDFDDDDDSGGAGSGGADAGKDEYDGWMIHSSVPMVEQSFHFDD